MRFIRVTLKIESGVGGARVGCWVSGLIGLMALIRYSVEGWAGKAECPRLRDVQLVEGFCSWPARLQSTFSRVGGVKIEWEWVFSLVKPAWLSNDKARRQRKQRDANHRQMHWTRRTSLNGSADRRSMYHVNNVDQVQCDGRVCLFSSHC